MGKAVTKSDNCILPELKLQNGTKDFFFFFF